LDESSGLWHAFFSLLEDQSLMNAFNRGLSLRHNFVISLIGVTALLLNSAIPSARAFDLSTGYSSETNPGPVWSFGWQSSIGGAFAPLTHRFTVVEGNGVEATAWALGPGVFPIVYHNGTTNTATAGQGTYPPGSTWFHPGFDNTPHNFGVIRCTIANDASGIYQLNSTVLPHLDGDDSGDCDYHVVVNGTELFGQFLAPRSGTNYNSTLVLNGGDTVDFLIGRGADGRLYGSGLKLDARLILLELTNTPPSIVAQPQSRVVTAGASVDFAVSARGAALSYQWLHDGVTILDATNTFLALTNVQSAESGDYWVVVSNAAGLATSAVATLSISGLAFDVAADYSFNVNPGAVWSYGWQSAIGGAFTPLTYQFSVICDNGVPVVAWALGAGNFPIVYHNATTNTAIAGPGTYPPGTTWFHPGFEETPYNFGVIRCTIPTNASGSYRLESAVLPHIDSSQMVPCPSPTNGVATESVSPMQPTPP